MNILIIATIIFLEMIIYLIFIDIILSWLTLLWIKFRPKFIYDILEILYSWIRKNIPTRIWYFDFTPIIIISLIYFIISLLLRFFPEVAVEIASLKM